MVFLEYINFEHNTVAAELVRQTYDTPPLAFVHSYGCQQNVNDGERIKGVLVDIGYGLCDKPEDADLILFNTCAVREHAEQRVFGNVGALKGLKEKKPGLIIGLCGCMANQKHVVEKLRKSYPYVDLVFGVDGIDTLPQLIAQKLQKHKRVLLDPAQRPVIVENIPIRRESEFRAWLPIMYGCDNFCSYCLIPKIRGRFRSRPMERVLAEARQLAERGYKELILVAQDLTHYGFDLYGRPSLAALLRELCRIDGLRWIRLHYLYPRELDDELIEVIASEPKIVKYIDIPIQHINDRILKRMNRRDTGESIRALFKKLRERIPGLVLRTSLITGLPGEGEEEFEELCEFLREAKIERAGVFPFSPEDGTPAAKMEYPPKDVAMERAALVERLQSEVMDAWEDSLVGREIEAICDYIDPETGLAVGRSYFDSPGIDGSAVLEGECKPGDIVTFRVEAAEDGQLRGRII